MLRFTDLYVAGDLLTFTLVDGGNALRAIVVLGSLAAVGGSVGVAGAAASAVETVPVPGDVPAFVLRARPHASMNIVFLHGRCTHALGYVQAFELAAMTRGTLVAPQGDLACGDGPNRRWSIDAGKIDARVNAAFRAAGQPEPAELKDIVLIGYSQGATAAEALAARWPERYSRVILIGAPTTPSAARLRAIRGAVMMAGDREPQQQMKAGARALQAAHVPATFLTLPDAAHGELGPAAETVMGDALDWLEINAKDAP